LTRPGTGFEHVQQSLGEQTMVKTSLHNQAKSTIKLSRVTASTVCCVRFLVDCVSIMRLRILRRKVRKGPRHAGEILAPNCKKRSRNTFFDSEYTNTNGCIMPCTRACACLLLKKFLRRVSRSCRNKKNDHDGRVRSWISQHGQLTCIPATVNCHNRNSHTM
jgi:hypothetical protein